MAKDYSGFWCEDDTCPYYDHDLWCCMRYNPDTDKCACEEGADDGE